MTGRKRYRFRIRWGIARATDDREGEIIGECGSRPSREAIEAILPRFLGTIPQSPPSYSAIKVKGRRAYALARTDAPPSLPPRPVEVAELRLMAIPDPDHADCEALVGKGTYVRALARDLGAALGTFAHIAELRRLSVGRFGVNQAIALDSIAERGHIATDCGFLLPIETGLDDIPALPLTPDQAGLLRQGRVLIGIAADDGLRHGVIVIADAIRPLRFGRAASAIPTWSSGTSKACSPGSGSIPTTDRNCCENRGRPAPSTAS